MHLDPPESAQRRNSRVPFSSSAYARKGRHEPWRICSDRQLPRYVSPGPRFVHSAHLSTRVVADPPSLSPRGALRRPVGGSTVAGASAGRRRGASVPGAVRAQRRPLSSAPPRPAPPRENSGQAAPPAAVRARCTAPRTRRSGCSRCRGGRAGSGRSSRWGARTAVPGTPAGNDSDEGGRGGGRGPAGPRRTCRPPRLLQVKAAPGYPLSASSSSWIIPLRAAARAAGRGARAAGKGASAPRPPEGSRAAPRPRGAAEAGAGLARPGGRARSAGGSPPGPGSNGRMGERAGFPEESPGAAGRAGLVRCPPLRSWGALAWPQEDG